MGLSQSDLADRIGIHAQQLYRIERGISENPSSDTIISLARELDISADYLLGLVDEPKGILREEDLNPMERRLLQAARSGLIVEALKALTSISEKVDQSTITGGKPTIDG
jgi:transcriptional regulator with XRE-family HTH domain